MKEPGKEFLYQRIKRQILSMSKSMSPGEKLPSRPALIKHFGVTRTTIDKAINALMKEGVLYSISGSGTYITEKNTNSGLTWGVIIPNIIDETDPLVLKGITEFTESRNILLIISHTDYIWEKQEEYIQEMINRKIDGLIILPAVVGEKGRSIFNDLKDRNIPFVFCHRPVDGIHTHVVSANYFQASFIGTDYLIKAGCERIVLIQPSTYSLSLLRYQGFLSAMAINGFEVKSEDIWMKDPDGPKDVFDFVKNRLSTNFNNIGFMCYTSGFAVTVHEAAQQMGYEIGDKVKIIGEEVISSNTMGSNILGNEVERMAESLGITAIKSMKLDLGFHAADLLYKLTQNPSDEDFETRVLMPEIITRRSCGEHVT